jgi:hypothetical protein
MFDPPECLKQIDSPKSRAKQKMTKRLDGFGALTFLKLAISPNIHELVSCLENVAQLSAIGVIIFQMERYKNSAGATPIDESPTTLGSIFFFSFFARVRSIFLPILVRFLLQKNLVNVQYRPNLSKNPVH